MTGEQEALLCALVELERRVPSAGRGEFFQNFGLSTSEVFYQGPRGVEGRIPARRGDLDALMAEGLVRVTPGHDRFSLTEAGHRKSFWLEVEGMFPEPAENAVENARKVCAFLHASRMGHHATKLEGLLQAGGSNEDALRIEVKTALENATIQRRTQEVRDLRRSTQPLDTSEAMRKVESMRDAEDRVADDAYWVERQRVEEQALAGGGGKTARGKREPAGQGEEQAPLKGHGGRAWRSLWTRAKWVGTVVFVVLATKWYLQDRGYESLLKLLATLGALAKLIYDAVTAPRKRIPRAVPRGLWARTRRVVGTVLVPALLILVGILMWRTTELRPRPRDGAFTGSAQVRTMWPFEGMEVKADKTTIRGTIDCGMGGMGDTTLWVLLSSGPQDQVARNYYLFAREAEWSFVRRGSWNEGTWHVDVDLSSLTSSAYVLRVAKAGRIAAEALSNTSDFREGGYRLPDEYMKGLVVVNRVPFNIK